ncbi:MAG TPA: cytochrome c biogenesis protein CcsA [Terriglobia bacterium]|nr:cytochrome c biogenesis protein CcsA [Terriglobia bacterium]
MPLRVVLLRLALGLYAVGLLHSILSVIKKKQTLFRPALVAVVGGLLCQVASMLLRAYEIRGLPLTRPYESFSFFAAVAVLGFLVAYARYGIASLGVFAFPTIFVMTFIATISDIGPTGMPAALNSNWIYIHTPLVILGYAALFMTFSAAVMYLIQERGLKLKQSTMLTNRLPSLDICDDLAYRSLAVGFPLMTLGILSGALWAQRFQVPHPEAKILLSFVTWFIYLGLIHYRLIGGWRGRKAAYLAIAGFIGVLMTFVGSYLGGIQKFY